MKKKLLVSITISLLVMSIISDQYLKQSFQLSLVEYLAAIQEFSDTEKAYLSSLSFITYGSDSNTPPLRYVDSNTHQYKGLVIDYLDVLSVELETPIEFTPMVWREALSSLTTGQIDICDMYPSKERSIYYDFSTPFYYQRGVILTSNASAVQSPRDISGHKIAGTDGDYAFEYLKTNYPGAQPVAAKDLEDAITLFLEGKVDAVLGDESVISYFLDKEHLNQSLYIAEGFLYEQEAVLAVKKGNQELLSILNKAITRLKTKETMSKIHQKWYGTQPLVTKDTQELKWQFIFQMLLMTLGLSFTLFYVWNRALSNEVNKRTKALHASGQVLEATFDGLNQFLLVLDKDKNVLETNQSFCDYANLNKSDMKSLNISQLPTLLNLQSLLAEINQIYLSYESFSIQFSYLGRSYQASGHPIAATDEAFKLLLFIADVTEQVTQQQQLLQSRKMVAVGQLAAGVAHEIRNPIGLIRNHSYLLKRQLKKLEDKDLDESLGVIDQSIERVNAIINNLLNFSKSRPTQQSVINMKTFTEDLLALNIKLFEQKNAQFDLSCDEQINVILPIEPMKHIFINLITNGIDALEDTGIIKILITESNGQLMINFNDNGVGIDPEHLETIFDPFFTTKAPEDGTGLGLYIVYNEIRKLNGNIEVESSPDLGTSFTCNIPLVIEHLTSEAGHE